MGSCSWRICIGAVLEQALCPLARAPRIIQHDVVRVPNANVAFYHNNVTHYTGRSIRIAHRFLCTINLRLNRIPQQRTRTFRGLGARKIQINPTRRIAVVCLGTWGAGSLFGATIRLVKAMVGHRTLRNGQAQMLGKHLGRCCPTPIIGLLRSQRVGNGADYFRPATPR
jgi:hypothetical protein